MNIHYLYVCFISLGCCMNVFVSPVPNKSIREAISSLCTLCLMIYITLDSAYNEKNYAEILLRYRQLFVKGNVFIGEWGIFGVEVFLHYRQFFIKGDFIIGRVECIYHLISCSLT